MDDIRKFTRNKSEVKMSPARTTCLICKGDIKKKPVNRVTCSKDCARIYRRICEYLYNKRNKIEEEHARNQKEPAD